MARFRFGSNEFINCSVPLSFCGRYFIVELGTPRPMVSVLLECKNELCFEVLKNQPRKNPLSKVSRTPPGIVTVVDKETDRFLYKVRPGSETSIVFGTITGQEVSARVTDRQIQVGGITVRNNVFDGVRAGIVVDERGGISIGAPIPASLLRWCERGLIDKRKDAHRGS